MLESSDLRLFLRIVELEGISAATRSLGMPKSSVSRKLARLEEQAGAALLERTPQNLRLTDAGHLLAHHARRIVDDVVEAETALGGLTAKPSGNLRIAVPSTFAARTLAAMLAGFMDRCASC